MDIFQFSTKLYVFVLSCLFSFDFSFAPALTRRYNVEQVPFAYYKKGQLVSLPAGLMSFLSNLFTKGISFLVSFK